MLAQYAHIEGLAASFDGSTASAIELSDALGVLSGMSYDLAAEMQSAIDSIHESYSSTLESMYLETLNDQQTFNYYQEQIGKSRQLMLSATSVEEVERHAADILRYSTAAYGMLSDQQKQQLFGGFESFLEGVEFESTERIAAIGDAMDNANDDLIARLTPLLTNAVTDIQAAAELQITAAGTQDAAANTQLDAANTPVQVSVTLDDSEVG